MLSCLEWYDIIAIVSSQVSAVQTCFQAIVNCKEFNAFFRYFQLKFSDINFV